MCSAIITKSNSFEGIKYAESFIYLFLPKRRQLFVKLKKEHSTDMKLWRPNIILKNTFFNLNLEDSFEKQDIKFFCGRKWQMKANLAVLQPWKTFRETFKLVLKNQSNKSKFAQFLNFPSILMKWKHQFTFSNSLIFWRTSSVSSSFVWLSPRS